MDSVKRKKIEQAVEELKGKWPENSRDDEIYLIKFESDAKYTTTFGLTSDTDRNICTRTEFEQVARDKGWCNGYKWGVEYNCKLSKPSLNEDILIDILENSAWLGERKAKEVNWKRVIKFRITDQRYKPKEPEGDWFKRGELPPERIKCEFDKGDKWVTAYTIGLDEEGCMVVDVQGEHPYQSSPNPSHFRPIRTERDELIEKALEVIQQDYSQECMDYTSPQEYVENAMIQIFYAGMLKMPSDSKDED